MELESASTGSSTLLKGLFFFITVLLVAAMGYATWIVVLFWDRVGV